MKVTPTFAQFCRLARKGNLIPIFTEFLADTETPVLATLKLDDGGPLFLLESVEGREKWGTYSFVGTDPKMIFTCKGQEIQIIRQGKVKRKVVSGNPLLELRRILQRYDPVVVAGVPRFHGGAVGYLGYDCVRYFEKIPNQNSSKIDTFDAVFFLTDLLVVFNNFRQQIQIIANALVPAKAAKRDLQRIYDQTIKKMEELKTKLQKPFDSSATPRKKKLGQKGRLPRPLVSKKQYLSMVNKAKKYVRQGDIIQVVLSNPYVGRHAKPPFSVYRALRLINPSPYMYYFRLGDLALVGSSPETLVRLEKDDITVRPIAGTRRRGKTAAEDQDLQRDLLADPKERAEHIMLVDLGRNDVGRVAQKGSVKVNELMKVEPYSHVMHIVSNVQGKLDSNKDMFDLLAATFPAGTLTGAPKIRAMEIIDELEKKRRGPYGGAIGYISYSGNMDFCITIRTLVQKGQDYIVQAGAGIVADSVPEREFQECENKAKAILRAVEQAGKTDE